MAMVLADGKEGTAQVRQAGGGGEGIRAHGTVGLRRLGSRAYAACTTGTKTGITQNLTPP